jgi:hypothetical protein|nr:MAG TPA: Nucleotide modification associated domain 1 [Caudoviricetes sp.]
MSLEERVKRHKEIVEELNRVYEQKNTDYGDSFAESVREFGIVAALTRISDKYNRFKRLALGNRNLVGDESIRDTLLDMANYCIMLSMILEEEQETEPQP